MKLRLMILLAVALFMSWQFVTASSGKDQNGDSVPDMLAEEQVKTLVAERPAPDGANIRMRARALQHQRLTPEQRQHHIDAGTIPFQITADVFMVNANGRRGRRADGNIVFYVLDVDGNVVDSGRRTIRQMCPT